MMNDAQPLGDPNNSMSEKRYARSPFQIGALPGNPSSLMPGGASPRFDPQHSVFPRLTEIPAYRSRHSAVMS